jgi:hypothetical protein
MDDNIWEYPFGDLDEDDDMFFRLPENRLCLIGSNHGGLDFDRLCLNRNRVRIGLGI